MDILYKFVQALLHKEVSWRRNPGYFFFTTVTLVSAVTVVFLVTWGIPINPNNSDVIDAILNVRGQNLLPRITVTQCMYC